METIDWHDIYSLLELDLKVYEEIQENPTSFAIQDTEQISGEP